MGVLGSLCSPNAGGEDGPTEWRLPEFWEDFLEEVVPGKGLNLGQGFQEGLWLEARHGGWILIWSGHIHLSLSLLICKMGTLPGHCWAPRGRVGDRSACTQLARRAARVCMVGKA